MRRLLLHHIVPTLPPTLRVRVRLRESFIRIELRGSVALEEDFEFFICESCSNHPHPHLVLVR